MEAFWAGLVSVGLAELGDKTQLLVFLLIRQFRRPLTVAFALVLAFALSYAIAAVLGAWLQQTVLLEWIAVFAALMFIGIGCWMLLIREDETRKLQSQPTSGISAFMLAFIAILVAELGDKSQLTVVALAMMLEPVGWIVFGASIGTLLVNLPLIWISQRSQTVAWIDARIHRWLRYLASAVFIAIGLFMLWAQFFSGTSNA